MPASHRALQDPVAPAPEVIHDSGLVTLWHRPDPSFKVPKASVTCHFQLAESYLSPEAAVMTQLYTKLLNDYLSEVRVVGAEKLGGICKHLEGLRGVAMSYVPLEAAVTTQLHTKKLLNHLLWEMRWGWELAEVMAGIVHLEPR
jgi:hypothetical protein